MYYGNLKGHKEYIFRQSDYGAVAHIAVDAIEWEQAWTDGDFANIRIDTWCGKNLKYGTNSIISIRTAGVRNACEYCWIEWSGSEEWDEWERIRYEPTKQSEFPF
jgi:hypothetical protein